MYDILLNDDGDLPERPTLVRGPEIVAQRIRRRLLMHRGEWLLDRRVGVPYVRWRERKPPRIENISAFVRDLITGTPGVLALHDFRAAFSPGAHTIDISGRIFVAGGEELAFEGATGLSENNVSGAVVFHTTSGAIL